VSSWDRDVVCAGVHITFSVSYSGEYRETVFGTHTICSVSLCDVHLRGVRVSVLTCVRASRLNDELSSAARETESREVFNATRRNRMTCCCGDDQYQIGQVRKGAK